MNTPERSPERDGALDALVAVQPFPGWTIRALCDAAGPDADLLFPGGPVDLVEAWTDLADRRMPPSPEGRVPDRVRAVIAARLAASEDTKDAVRRGLAVLAARPGTSARTLARTVDAIWHAAGDESTDWSWYSKRAILAAVYSATLLFWLNDYSAGGEGTLAFLDRRLAGVGRLGQIRRKAGGFAKRWLPGVA